MCRSRRHTATSTQSDTRNSRLAHSVLGVLRTRLIALVVAALAIVGVVAMSRTSSRSAKAQQEPVSNITPSTQSSSAVPTTAVPATSAPTTSATTATTTPSTTAAAPESAPPAPPTGLADAAHGRWSKQLSLGGRPALWTLSMHPLAKQPNVTLTAAVFEPAAFTSALYNGSSTPGGGPWVNGDRVPAAARPALAISFNGGFLFKHITGGYAAEGRHVKALAAGQATLGVRHDGRLVLGIFGSDLTDDGTWLALRQNLPPIVEQGRSSIAKYPGTYWGDNFHQVQDDFRSAICTRADGRLMYVAMGMVRIETLARTLPALGCVLGMELDINGHWPQFVWFTGAANHRVPHLLDRRMWKPNRVFTGSEKDFFALFDPATLPTDVVYRG